MIKVIIKVFLYIMRVKNEITTIFTYIEVLTTKTKEDRNIDRDRRLKD
jgi:hypothetical protein